ncbi:hypothetical protein SRABI27_03323 [Pedobacter sp. Bi27]|uniref:DUF5689 domain-containing protein n=1 Tax=unclassified Pedobacter TaxID=2628915 RepID=UPI001D49A265|nr:MULTISPECIES: DUF5689 domain-containing protein [unclassified Pedobacter]CAH0150680.1 hypothetical protein SRABI36_00783 [Pedobacter sp. Bi36]CAH0206781.1 hypothetical protein SRABI126_01875 [Pedobacter sp. Bi126]CAH0264913.1 hypothetical protein SRABI27_03323 [Pedobacter sp. Bi27]
MKNTLKYINAFAVIACILIVGCDKQKDEFVLGTISPFISNFDLKKSYKETDLVLNTTVMKGANSIKGVVISDFVAGNTPKNLLVVQNSRIVGNGIDSVRGIAINIGADAAKYTVGDSVHIKVEGGILKRVDGVLQIEGVNSTAVNKIASGKNIKVPIVNIANLIAQPLVYENTLVTVSNAVVEPEPVQGDTFSGDKTINDGFGKAKLHTEATANFSGNQLPSAANFTGVAYFKTQNNQPQLSLWVRNANDIFALPLVKPSPIIISGYLTNPGGSEAVTSGTQKGAYEYVQLLVTKDIDFSVTPYSLVTTNNAGSANPAPANGWATGGVRTYKINITSGTAKKGDFIYVGGYSKLIWGFGSTNISSANWVAAVDYANNDGANFGTKNTNLLANSGNVAGIALFEGTTVNASTMPVDVIMYGGGNPNSGNVYAAGPPELGYRITNTDYYTTINPSSRLQQNFFAAGSNTNRLGFQVEQTGTSGGGFIQLGGVYITSTGRWEKGRLLTNIVMSTTATISDLQTGAGVTVLKN